MNETYNPEKWTNIFENILEFIKGIIKNTKESLEKLKLNTLTSTDLSWLKQWSGKTNNTETSQEQRNNPRDNKETQTENMDTKKLKSLFEKNATNLSIDKIDGKDFFEVSYTDKNSSSKVKGIIRTKK